VRWRYQAARIPDSPAAFLESWRGYRGQSSPAASMTRDYITVSQSILASLVGSVICLLFAFQ
jgi:hypothetical protein